MALLERTATAVKTGAQETATLTGRAWSSAGQSIKQKSWRGFDARLWRLHGFALFLFVLFGVLPFALFFSYAQSPFDPVFDDCTGAQSEFSFYGQGNAGPKIQGIFVINALAGDMSFATAKFVDVVWDLCVGRGAQALAWIISYQVFSKALIHAIEISPIPFRSFTSISIDGSSIMTFWTLLFDLRRHKSKRIVALFVYLILAVGYILSVPTFLSAATGYVSSNQLYLNVDQSLVDMSEVHQGVVVVDGERIGLSNETCVLSPVYASGSAWTWSDYSEYTGLVSRRETYCPCKLSNGTLLESPLVKSSPNYQDRSLENCSFNDTQTNATFEMYSHLSFSSSGKPQTYSCMMNFNLTVNGQNYDLGRTPLNTYTAACFRNQSMATSIVIQNMQCLPSSSTDALYFWGFSSMLAGIFVILQLVWAGTMYGLWLETMINSKAVRGGMKLSQMRSIFAVAAASQEKLDMTVEEMVTMPESNIKELSEKSSMVERRHLVGDQESKLLKKRVTAASVESD